MLIVWRYTTSFRSKEHLYSESHPYGRVQAKRHRNTRQPKSITSNRNHLTDPIGTHNLERRVVLQKYENVKAIRGMTTRPGSSATAELRLLPYEIQTRIFSHLDYQSLVRLSQTSHYFQKKVHPDCAEAEDKLQFVMRAERDFLQHRPTKNFPGNFACYCCFRVLSPFLFAKNQRDVAYVDKTSKVVPDDAVDASIHIKLWLRRFCINCGLAYGFHSVGERQEAISASSCGHVDAE